MAARVPERMRTVADAADDGLASRARAATITASPKGPMPINRQLVRVVLASLSTMLLPALAAAQEPKPAEPKQPEAKQLLRYTWKETNKVYLLYETRWVCTDPATSLDAKLQIWIELKITKVKGDIADATATYLRVLADSTVAGNQVVYDSQDKDRNKKSRLSQANTFPDALHELAGKSGTLKIDTRGQITANKLPKGITDPQIAALLGSESGPVFGLALVSLPKEPVGVGHKWPTPWTLAVGPSATVKLDVVNELTALDAKQAVCNQQVALTDKGDLALVDGAKSTGILDFANGFFAPGSRKVDLAFRGPVSAMGVTAAGNIAVSVSIIEPPPVDKKKGK